MTQEDAKQVGATLIQFFSVTGQEDMISPKVSHDLTDVVETVVEAVTTSNPKARCIIMLTYLQDTLFDKALSLIFSTSPSVTAFPGPSHDIERHVADT